MVDIIGIMVVFKSWQKQCECAWVAAHTAHGFSHLHTVTRRNYSHWGHQMQEAHSFSVSTQCSLNYFFWEQNFRQQFHSAAHFVKKGRSFKSSIHLQPISWCKANALEKKREPKKVCIIWYIFFMELLTNFLFNLPGNVTITALTECVQIDSYAEDFIYFKIICRLNLFMNEAQL